ncbi:MAG: LysE family translocator [Flavobacteriaceae bacterium]|nr:LysE family translocator [Flavobacteriaceae bacterium]
MISSLLSFLTASILLTISPGPDIIYVLVKSMTAGKKAGFMISIGLVSGILVHTSLVAFGVAAIIQQSEFLFQIVQFLGAGYLLFIAFSVYRSEDNFSLKTSEVIESNQKLLKRGFLMNVLNPKVSVFFLAFFPSFISNTEAHITFQLYLLGGVFMLQALLIFSLVALSAGKIATYIQQNSRLLKVFKWVQIAVFVLIAFALFL